MKVIFLTEGGKDIGFGHLTRCISLCQAFEEKGIMPQGIVNGDGMAGSLLEGRKKQIFNWLEEEGRLLKILRGDSATIVIVDSYLADTKIYRKISESSMLSLYIDDNKRIDYPKGIVLNGSVYADRLNFPKTRDVFYLLGTKYIPLRKEFWAPQKKEIRQYLETILITFGGSDPTGMTPKILRLLTKDYPNITKKVVIGRGFKNVDEITSLKDNQTQFIYNPQTRGMKALMQASDIAISAGGQTLYELAALGVPAIGVCTAGNQLNNLKGWQKAGFIEYAGWWGSEDVWKNIRLGIERLKDQFLRAKRSSVGQRFVDGGGSLKICDLILKNRMVKDGTA